ncbi:MAG: ABC transporter permease [Chitinispirillaceae bacterium]|nr:ABC transporter permease [Chitinispirillaceae bacterium]
MIIENSSSSNKSDTFLLPELLNRAWVENKGKELFYWKLKELRLDFSNTKEIDSTGVAFVRSLNRYFIVHHQKLILKNISSQQLRLLKSYPGKKIEPPPKRNISSLFVSIANGFLALLTQIIEATSVLVEMLYWGSIGVIKKSDIRRGSLLEQMYLLGFKAAGIVGILSFLIGIVLSLQTAMQLRTYGAGIFLAPLIGISMVRELGPLLTAIILAGRTGSATTAEIATMSVNEEIDALKTMGINPIQFVVVPKFWAITITMPLLTIIATATGILGGYLIGILYLDLSTDLFFSEFSKHIKFNDVFANVIKSLVFSWLIISIGAFYGLRVRGGAEAVGRETTNSVVTGIFVIIIADALFSFIL